MFNVTIKNGTESLLIHRGTTTTDDKILNGTITKSVNQIDSFTFTIYPQNKGYGKIYPMATLVNVVNVDKPNDKVFCGRVLTITPTMDEQGVCCKAVVCEGELGYLCDSVMMYSTLTGVTMQQYLQTIINKHNQQVGADKTFELGTVTSTITHDFEFNYDTAFESISAIISDESIGGEIRLRYANDKRYLDYTAATFDKDSTTKIELSVNMKSASWTQDPTSIITRLIPLGAKVGDTDERLTITTINNGKNYIDNTSLIADYGIIVGTQVWDEISGTLQLYNKGKAWLANQKPLKKSYSVSAVDLSLLDKSYDSFEVGTQYHVINPLINLDDTLRCIGQTIVIDDPTQTSVTFGDKYATLTSLTANKQKALKNQITNVEKKQRKEIINVVDEQTNLLCGGSGGYVYYNRNANGEPTEIFFLNKADISTATSAIRINQSGIGFWKSSDGGTALKGPYTSAWTIDGTLNTDYIVADTLKGIKINNGDGTFTVDKVGNVVAKALSSHALIMMDGGLITLLSDDRNGGSNNAVMVTADSFSFKHSGVEKINANTSTGKISANDVLIKLSDSGGYISLREFVNNHS